MLTVFSPGRVRTCDGVSRRDFLRVGALSLGGLTLADLLAAKASAANGNFVRDRSVVLLYLSGGASHIETFDPKMTAPDGVRSVTGEVATKLPGVTFGGTFPGLAARADRLSVVRSFWHTVGDHEKAHVHVLSGGTAPQGLQTTGFSIGSAYTRLRGTNHPATGMPSYIALTEKEIDGQYSKERERFLAGSWPGSIGPSYAPFQHEIGWETKSASKGKDGKAKDSAKAPANPLAANMHLNLSAEALDDRLRLLKEIDALNRRLDATGTMAAADKFSEQALSLLLGGAVKAFDLQGEDPRLLEKYDTSHIRIGFKSFRPSTLGKQMLLARRLCEAGAGFVSISSAGWDMHADGNNPGMATGMEMLGRSLDQAVSAFLDDVRERGLAERILLVITGDFGRTPKVNARGGRDHWAKLGTLAFAGGGLNMGQVVGQSARGADVPAVDPVSTPELLATVMHSMFDLGQLRVAPGIPRDLAQKIAAAQPIGPLV